MNYSKEEIAKIRKDAEEAIEKYAEKRRVDMKEMKTILEEIGNKFLELSKKLADW